MQDFLSPASAAYPRSGNTRLGVEVRPQEHAMNIGATAHIASRVALLVLLTIHRALDR